MKKFVGRHLIIDAYGIDSGKLQNKELLRRVLEDLPAKLGMRILKKPSVSEIKSKIYPSVGLSGFVILYESHASFHTWPEENFIAIDIFSCKDFNEKNAINYIKKFLNPKKLRSKSIIRG